MGVKYSIVIGTYNHLEDALKPCIESLLKHTKLDEVEVIIVANGCTDGTKEYLELLDKTSFKIIWDDKPLGFAKAYNKGLKAATGEYLVILNNDTEIQASNWLEQLQKPFKEPGTQYAGDSYTGWKNDIGITGLIQHNEVGFEFIIFCCAMISRGCYETVGLLDETFGTGGMEDVDYCIRAEKAGFKFVTTDGQRRANFPLIHKAETTVHHLPEGRDWWEGHFHSNQRKLAKKYGKNLGSNVTATISTRDRYFTTLPETLIALCNQTVKPEVVVVYDDGEQKDLRNEPLYQNIFALLQASGIQWHMRFGARKGQVDNHQRALSETTTEFIWRLDDDNVPKPDCLEKLLQHMDDPQVGAVAGLVVDPKNGFNTCGIASNKIEDIYLGLNQQWFQMNEVQEVDHLYSSFLFRKDAGKHGYCKELSKVGHREETIFSYEMKRAGWKLLVEPKAFTWHLRFPTGGIRSENDHQLWAHDEQIFTRKLVEWEIVPKSYKLVILDCGLGDHLIFSMILPEMHKKYPDIIVAACFPEVFEDDKNIKLISIADSHYLMDDIGKLNVYKWMWDNKWAGTLEDAYRGLYLS